ncbi:MULTISPECIES: DUF2000 domain-containing protein [unclassified Nocardia]|uniref:DUF2000 domain-containing protein n=1 Tax=unclassified Nocardia TaxID=2637762 RepID=UPI001CE49DF4|nr:MULTISPECIES: DUF2000 domain-containing protein [unclassified Nocardia]
MSKTKIAVVLRDDLATWQRLNVTAFLASGIAVGCPSTGEAYQDGSGVKYLPMFTDPVLVYAADPANIDAAYQRALSRELPMSIYPEDLFGTFNDEDNRTAVRALTPDDLRLAGFALHGPRNAIDKVVKGLPLHP